MSGNEALHGRQTGTRRHHDLNATAREDAHRHAAGASADPHVPGGTDLAVAPQCHL
jgi:hypothetical protein